MDECSSLRCHKCVVIVQNESELFGRTIRVNLAKPMKAKEGSSRPGINVPVVIICHAVLSILVLTVL